MSVDVLPDEAIVASTFKRAELYRIDPSMMTARLLVDGHALGLVDMGNCVVDDEGYIWVNEVTGCRLWRFDSTGRPTEVLGCGRPGFQSDCVPFAESRFHWIYDIRRGPDGRIYILEIPTWLCGCSTSLAQLSQVRGFSDEIEDWLRRKC